MFSARAIPLILFSVLLAACAKRPEPAASTGPSTQATESQAPAPSSDVHPFKIGELAAFALKDGELKFPNDAKTVGVGHSPDEIAALLKDAGASTTELSLSIQPLLVKAGDKVLLFDTGVDGNMGPGNGKLMSSLKEAGMDPASVTDIFISHSHGDHVGGLIDTTGALAFPNATIHLSAPEYAFLKGMDAKAAQMNGVGHHDELLSAIAQKVDAFAPGSEIIPGLVKAVDIKGHTPGHSGYLITSGGDSLLYMGDAAHHYIVSVQQPDWTIAFDAEPAVAQASRKALIEQSASTGQRIYAVHFPFPGIGKFTKSGDHYVWTPEH
jgi:glyoxylase-like metal-dependent hydrolase (beta-lactamase superfamily II)